MRRLRAIQYHGGKGGGRNRPIGDFVATALPARSTYSEPFAGMLGVLLRRQPARCEIVNDLDDLVVNWWRCVRYQGEELHRQVWAMPMSEREFTDSLARLDRSPPLSEEGHLPTALAFFAVCQHSILHTASGKMRRDNSFAVHYRTQIASEPPSVLALCERMRNVQILHRDALTILERLAGVEDASIFCDPPYVGTENDPYAASVDRGRLADLLREQAGAVAISGYGDEWDCLEGWTKREFPVLFSNSAGGATPRCHAVWTNFRPDTNRLFSA